MTATNDKNNGAFPLWQQAMADQLEQARELAEIKTQLSHLNEGVTHVREQLALLFALSKDLAALAQRQDDHSDSLRRIHHRLDETDKAVLLVDQFASRWVNRAVGGWIIGGLLLAVVQALVLDRVKAYETSQTSAAGRLDALDGRLARIEFTHQAERNK